MFNQTAVRVRAGTRLDRGGNTIPDWSPGAVTELTVTGLNIQPNSQSERADEERTAVVTGYRVQSAEGTAPDITAADRIEYAGLVYEVEGEVGVWPELFSDTVHHIDFVMVRATG
ncbi:hypothetical protein OG594_08980 [Streptomyces sp. NBC_01214]|uniref:hypothetical protein n=1 Tax=Streptomyces sp. NBC_01214 TaxID=2903777 RepID=UPI0022581119|nr:hypothetical protein [Streptomyces sp. NBC_01214]MCX4801783.1 hypothetical protein [Streptomyces sp. NBC_01214]